MAKSSLADQHPIAHLANQYRQAVLLLQRTERLDLAGALTDVERQEYLDELQLKVDQCLRNSVVAYGRFAVKPTPAAKAREDELYALGCEYGYANWEPAYYTHDYSDIFCSEEMQEKFDDGTLSEEDYRHYARGHEAGAKDADKAMQSEQDEFGFNGAATPIYC